MYADDTVLIADAETQLQILLKTVVGENKMKVAADFEGRNRNMPSKLVQISIEYRL